MDSRADSMRLFQEEHEVLKAAKSFLEDNQSADGAESLQELRGKYGKLVDDYERLLKTSMKVSRISDIQGRALMERENEIRVANDNLKQMEIMRRDLISDITHELGTPMTALQGYVKALLDGVVPLDRQYLHTMYDKVLIMNQLIDDLFELAKLRGNRLSYHLRELLVEDVVEPLSRFGIQEAAKKNIRLVVIPWQADAAAGTLIVRADLIRIEQVMNNLLNNAVKFTPSGREVRVSFSLQRGDGGAEEGAELQLLVEVSDTGPGIPEDELPFLFDRFYRGSYTRQEDIQGNGLGLAIAKEIITNHGGAIGVRSKPGEGSTFYFRIPVQEIGC